MQEIGDENAIYELVRTGSAKGSHKRIQLSSDYKECAIIII